MKKALLIAAVIFVIVFHTMTFIKMCDWHTNEKAKFVKSYTKDAILKFDMHGK